MRLSLGLIYVHHERVELESCKVHVSPLNQPLRIHFRWFQTDQSNRWCCAGQEKVKSAAPMRETGATAPIPVQGAFLACYHNFCFLFFCFCDLLTPHIMRILWWVGMSRLRLSAPCKLYYISGTYSDVRVVLDDEQRHLSPNLIQSNTFIIIW